MSLLCLVVLSQASSQLLLQHHACLPATMLVQRVMDSPSEPVSPNKLFCLYVALVMVYYLCNRKVTKTHSYSLKHPRGKSHGSLQYPGAPPGTTTGCIVSGEPWNRVHQELRQFHELSELGFL